jgi:putative FmdB family regulatory protein
MPTYEYKCDACGYAFERFQPITSDPIKRCPECKKAKVRRLIGTGAGMIFKGSGFYITDYRSESYNNAAKADSGAAPAESKSESKTEAKTGGEQKSESKPAESKPAAPEPKPAAPKPEPKASKSAKK